MKCRIGLIWCLFLSVILTIIPLSREQKISSVPELPSSVDTGNPIPEIEVVEDTIQKNTNLVATLVDYNISATMAHELAGLIQPVFDVRKLRFGNPFRLEKNSDGTLKTFEYKIDDESVLKVERGANSYAATVEKLELESRQTLVTTEIQSSLWEALASQPKGEYLVTETAQIFQWEVDFSTEIQPGDQIRLIVDEMLHDGNFVKNGKIHAAELLNNGQTYRAFLFKDSYYDEKGNSIKRAMLASPLKFTPRVSSGFTRRRMHPVLGFERAHLATDYAAPPGSPVVAVANGTVTSAGWSGGYGNLVQIRHANGLTTGYAHLSRIAAGVRAGHAVKQGDLVGLVGQTGLATGPHLHFMMAEKGMPINPVLALKKGQPAPPISASLKAEFFRQVAPVQLKLETVVAAND